MRRIGFDFGKLSLGGVDLHQFEATMTEITQGGPEDDRSTEMVRDEPDYARYKEVHLEGQVLLYDVDETEAWIQSDVALPIEDVT